MGKSIIVWMIWIAERRVLMEDLILHERVSSHPTLDLAGPFLDEIYGEGEQFTISP